MLNLRVVSLLSAFSLSLAQRTVAFGGGNKKSRLFHQSHFHLAPPDGVPPAEGAPPPASAADGAPAPAATTAAADADGQTWLRLCQTCGQQSYWREGACLNPNCSVIWTSEKWLEAKRGSSYLDVLGKPMAGFGTKA